ncbi:hypothetical protein F511_47119 [Dorcoceras hygrometricum]|uniref:Uncharacterized protein n=1 Tax=Dorcoceras hygrometricum TaxID=472368 RepID=A0A2Z6ZRW2_9LAMI|nr:hypothetical protein F511_47119 [Dorcoceras hygrometricum]
MKKTCTGITIVHGRKSEKMTSSLPSMFNQAFDTHTTSIQKYIRSTHASILKQNKRGTPAHTLNQIEQLMLEEHRTGLLKFKGDRTT